MKLNTTSKATVYNRKQLIAICIPIVCALQHGNANDSIPADRIRIEASYSGDMVRNFAGGQKRGNAYLGIIDFGIGFNTENLGLWKGGEFVVQVENTHGATPTADLVGDLQVFSNIENGDYSYLYMAWYRQTLGNLSILAGIHDLNSEFHITEFSGNLINSAFGIMSAASLNFPVPIFPKTAFGTLVSFKVSEKIGMITGVYDGDPYDLDNEKYNLGHTLNKEQGLLSITEIHIHNPAKFLNGTYKLGFQYHSAKFTDLSDTTKLIEGNRGIYFLADHNLISYEDGLQLGCFLQLGYAPGLCNINPFYLGTGFTCSNFFLSRPDDILSLGIAYAGINREIPGMLNSETSIELSYLLQLHPNISLQPDIQYIINPGAVNSIKNAIVGMIRININN